MEAAKVCALDPRVCALNNLRCFTEMCQHMGGQLGL
jgi:hypothetical protein